MAPGAHASFSSANRSMHSGVGGGHSGEHELRRDRLPGRGHDAPHLHAAPYRPLPLRQGRPYPSALAPLACAGAPGLSCLRVRGSGRAAHGGAGLEVAVLARSSATIACKTRIVTSRLDGADQLIEVLSSSNMPNRSVERREFRCGPTAIPRITAFTAGFASSNPVGCHARPAAVRPGVREGYLSRHGALPEREPSTRLAVRRR